MGIASCFHLCTAMYQTPDVFGIKALMIPAYMICIVLRWWTTVDMLLNPTCYYKIIREYICLSIYTWCRLYFVVFFTMRIFEHNRYTVSIILAGFTCAPSCGPAFNLGIAMFAFGYLILVGCCFGEENRAWQLTEGSGSMFKNPTFRGFLMAAPGQDIENDPDSVGEAPETRIARMMFDQFDADGSGTLDYEEMGNMGAKFGSSDLGLKVQAYLDHKDPNRTQGGVDFEAFRKIMFPGRSHHHIDMARYKSCTTDQDKARLIFDSIVAEDEGSAITVEEMQSLFIEWGMPRREIKRMFELADKDHSGEIEFKEFYQHMKPVWKFQFKELRGTILEVEHIRHRSEVLHKFEHSQLTRKEHGSAQKAKAASDAAGEIAALKAQLKISQLEAQLKATTASHQASEI
jgi:hypothetical protein